MTVLGKDRPGLVESVADVVRRHGGNWLESRMARLGGQFAGILRVAVPAKRQGELQRALAALDQLGLTVVVHPDEDASGTVGHRLAQLEVVGQDRPGIVREIAHALAAAGINVEELETHCRSAAMSGEPIFQARFHIALPPGCAVEKLHRIIEAVAADLIVDVTLREASAEGQTVGTESKGSPDRGPSGPS